LTIKEISKANVSLVGFSLSPSSDEWFDYEVEDIVYDDIVSENYIQLSVGSTVTIRTYCNGVQAPLSKVVNNTEDEGDDTDYDGVTYVINDDGTLSIIATKERIYGFYKEVIANDGVQHSWLYISSTNI